MSNYKISVVNYLNSKPFIYGLRNYPKIQEWMTLVEENPAQCADSLIQDKTDIALIPAAMILQLKNPHIISSYCIGSVGKVKTVCLFSNVPIEEVTDVILDEQSRTSVRLFQILANEYWKLNFNYHPSEPNSNSKIIGTTAAVVIGDRTIPMFEKYEYVYDLGEIWEKMTGLPFVFAAWVAPFALKNEFVQLFHQACELGMGEIDQIVEEYSDINTENFNIETYYKKYISYPLDELKRQGLDLFLQKVAALENWEFPEIIYQLPEMKVV
ncbi:MAG TPA: menaquinone biosynthesis protein [Chitinophagales bacterium]|nr:menaquinone biosynthesis protein [Chitinophagales bacterium]